MTPRGDEWGDPEVVASYLTSGVTDPGERAALAASSPQGRRRVLDVGVGAGRTTGLLLPSAESYLGVDIAAGMIEQARRRHPGADLRVMDVCDLGELTSGAFDLVVFSFNGIDALDHERRRTALHELARVLAPEGRLVFSSLTTDGISYGETPWTVHVTRPRVVAYRFLQLLRHPARWVRSVRNYRRTRRGAVRSADWAMSPMRAHEFRFLVHFATVGCTARMLGDAGLQVESAWDERGRPVVVPAQRTDAHYVHYLCRHD